MAGHQAFPDVELMLVGDGAEPGILESFGQCFTELPVDFQKEYLPIKPVIRVSRIGGGEGNSKTTDRPRVLIQVYVLRDATKPRQAHDVATAIRAHLLNGAQVTEWGRFDSAETESGPSAFPWPDPIVRVAQLIVRASTRR